MRMFVAVLVALWVGVGAEVAQAQTYIRTQPVYDDGVIDSTADSNVIEIYADRLGSFGTVKIQTADSYTGTWEVQCAVGYDSPYDEDNELALKLVDSSSTVYEVSDTIGIWDVLNAQGCRKIRVMPTAGFSGTDSHFYAFATQVPAGGGGGSGGGDASEATLSDVSTNTATTATNTTTMAAACSGGVCSVNVAQVGGNAPVFDACSTETKTTTAVSLTARTVIIPAVAAKKNYICSISVMAGGTAEVFNVVEGTGTTCQTGTAALVGSTTAANGMAFAANGGLAMAGGDTTVIQGATANVDTCIVPSGSNRLSGFVTWVQK